MIREIGASPDFIIEFGKKCVRCGQCRSVCPVFTEFKTEGFSPRARVFLADMIHRSCKGSTVALNSRGPAHIDYADSSPDARTFTDNAPTDILKKAWDRNLICLLCGACATDCPSGVPVCDIILSMRKEYVAHGGRPKLVAELSQRIRETHNVVGEDNENRWLWMEEHTPIPVHSECQVTPLRRPQGLVYFTGCVASLYPGAYKIPRSMIQIMNRTGIGFALLGGEEWCCGYPLSLLGLDSEADEIAGHNLEKVVGLGADTVMTSCPSCYYTWRHLIEKTGAHITVIHYTQLLNGIVADQAVKLSPMEVVATYHDPCDLGRKSGIYDPPREVLRSIPGLTFNEITPSRKDARCCGGGGNLETIDPELSRKLAEARLSQASDTGAELIVTACQQCARTLSNAARKLPRTRNMPYGDSEPPWPDMEITVPRKMKVRDIADIVLSCLQSP
jgi:heterodisulfide reductase subunit D